MSARAEGVLAVMDAIQRRLDDSHGHHSFPEYVAARATVAELIEQRNELLEAAEVAKGAFGNLKGSALTLVRMVAFEMLTFAIKRARAGGAS